MPASRQRLRALLVGASDLALVAIGVGGTVAASDPPTLYAWFNVNGAVAMSTAAVRPRPRARQAGSRPVPAAAGTA